MIGARAILAPASALFFGLLAGTVSAQDLAVRCGKLHVGNGKVQSNVWVVVKNGKIASIEENQPENLPVIDASDKTVMPGIVAADTNLSGQGDAPYNVTPHFVGMDGFDLMTRRPRQLSGGVTAVYLSPGRNRLIPGRGSVVKLFGDDLVQRVLAEASCLRITMGKESTKAPALFEPNPAPTADDPLVPARQQVPTARISQLTELRRIFREALTAEAGAEAIAGKGSAENRYPTEALTQAAKGRLPLRIAAKKATDIRRALSLASPMGGQLTLENPHELARVAKIISTAKARCVFRIPVLPGSVNTGGENRLDRSPSNNPENAALAEQAGITFALAASRDADLADMLLIAGIAVRHGCSPQRALRAITLDAAVVLGIDDRVGSLEPGKDADFLILSGDPLAIGTLVEKTFVDGRLAYERNNDAKALAIRVSKIHTLEGNTITDGVIIAEKGKIKAVGSDLAIPNGARVIDLPGSVMVPGFINAFSHLGLSGEGTGVPQGAADQVIAEAVQYDDPLFQDALSAGLTTVLVSGFDSNGPIGGRVAALKTGAADRESMILRATAAIRLFHDSTAPDGIKSLESALNRGKSYLDAWKKYEKALADFEAGKAEKPPEEVPEETPAATTDPISGTWSVEVTDLPFPIPISITATLKLEGTSVSGSAVMRMRDTPRDVEISGSFENGKIKLTIGPEGRGGMELEGTVSKDSMAGAFRMGGGRIEGKFTASRMSAAAAATAASSKKVDSGKPSKPNIDENLEPLKALWEQKIPAIVRSNKEPAIRSVVKWFTEKKLPFVLTGLNDAIETPEILGAAKPPALLGPDLIRRDGRKIINAAATMADVGLPFALGTGDTAGSRYLPVHASLAIRYGLDPTEALKALTLYPAQIFKLDDRVGSLKRGKDADFVVFSGGPFEMTSQILLVVVNGRVVIDRREKK
ncbi:MAG: amidohydrolase family protein [Planctomycetota bacterium]|jgi:imidazolonepropionase-like amidohydrolase|nr:amidohydrolase family protein [Planctomycetota bacterium]